jgi:hypothetical protein
MIDGVPQENILAFPFDHDRIAGNVAFNEAFAERA